MSSHRREDSCWSTACIADPSSNSRQWSDEAHTVNETAHLWAHPDSSIINSRLHNDILYIIFMFYLANETPDFPLETILLVCRFWTNAAVSYHTLWARFRIEIASSRDAIDWSERITRRLGNAGEGTPIFVDIRETMGMNGMRSEGHIHTVLDAICGPHGLLCSRWKQISIRLSDKLTFFNCKRPYFSYPTPVLTTLRLLGVRIYPTCTCSPRPGFIPSAPSLRVLSLIQCELPSLPDIRSTTVIDLRFFRNSTFTRPGLDLSTLVRAEQLQFLAMDYKNFIPSDLPYKLRSLTTLYLGTMVLPVNFCDVKMPRLRNLYLMFDPDIVYEIIRSTNIPFNQIKTLSISFDQKNLKIKDYTQFQAACVSLLKECGNVDMIYCYGDAVKAVLKVLREDCLKRGGLLPHPISISRRDGEPDMKLEASAAQRSEQIDVLAATLGGLEVEFDGRIKGTAIQ